MKALVACKYAYQLRDDAFIKE